MKPLSLNLSKMKKVGGDKESSLFQHPDGHQIRVAHSGLNPLQKKQMEKLPVVHFKSGGMAGGNETDLGDPAPVTADVVSEKEPEKMSMTPNAPDWEGSSGVAPPVDNQITSTYNADLPKDADSSPSASNPVDNETVSSKQDQSQPQQIPQQGSSLDQQLAQNQKDIAQIYQGKAQSDANFENALRSQKIDPNRFWNSKSTGSKVGSALALLFGGMASRNGQPNPALSILHDQINKDVDAQANDQSKTLNLWKMHNEAIGSNAAAKLQTQNNLLTIAKVKAEEQAGQLGGPMADQINKLTQSKINQEIAMNNYKLSAFQGASKPSGDQTEQQHIAKLNALQMIAPELYKDAEGKYIPGVGVATKSVDPKEIESMRDLSSLEKGVDNAIHFSKTIGTTLPYSTADQSAKDIRDGLWLQIGKLHGLNRINEEEAKKYTSMVGDPGAIRTGKALQSFNDLKREISDKRMSTMQAYGIKPFAQAPSQNIAIQWAQSHPNDPRSAQILNHFGNK